MQKSATDTVLAEFFWKQNLALALIELFLLLKSWIVRSDIFVSETSLATVVSYF